MSLKKNLAYNFLLSVSQVIFPLLSIPYISRVLHPDGIGQVNFIDSLTYYFIAFAEFGIATYGVREVARKRKDKEALRQLVSELVSLHLITSLVAIVAYCVAVFFLYQKIGDFRLILFSASFLLVNAFTCEWYFWGTQNFGYITVRSLLVRVLGLISIFLLIHRPEHYFIYYAIISLSAIITIGWNFSKMASEVPLRFRKLEWKKHIRITKVTYLIGLVYSIPLLLDNVLLGLLTTTAAVAFYAFAIKLVRIIGALITDTFTVFYPQTVSLVADKDHKGTQETILLSSDIILLFSIPVCAGIFLVAPDFTGIYFGPEFGAVAEHLRVLSLYPLVKSLSIFLSKQLLLPYDKEKRVLNSLLLGAIAFVASIVPFCYWWGGIGASLALIFSEILILGATVIYTFSIHKKILLVNVKTVMASVSGAVIFLLPAYLFNSLSHSGWVRMTGTILSCMLIYILLTLFVFKIPTAVMVLNTAGKRIFAKRKNIA